MINLAGRFDCDQFIEKELKRCNIPILTNPQPANSEVPYRLMGVLGNFKFRRAWYYWAVEGNMPLEVAEILYANPVGATDIRVAGHCACPPPKDWVTYIAEDGRELLPASLEYQAEKYRMSEEFLKKYLFVDDVTKFGKPYITSYHIDTELGLYIFANAIRPSNLIKG